VDPPAEAADPDDDRGVDGEHGSRAAHAELAGVQRHEGGEAGEADHRGGECEPRQQGGAVEQAPRRARSGRHGWARLRQRRPEQAAQQGAAGRDQPDGVVPVPAEHELAEQRSDREAAPHRERVEGERLAAPLVGGEVVHHRRRADEDQRLAGARQQAQPHEQR
jgi:hypothetical protein